MNYFAHTCAFLKCTFRFALMPVKMMQNDLIAHHKSFCRLYNGNIVATGEVSAYSDRRLKSNIRSLDNRGRLSAKTFLKDNKQQIGFIAQDVQELYPELISTTSGPEQYLSLNYGAITAVLSIQINDVEDEVSILKEKVKQLENKIKQYEEINF